MVPRRRRTKAPGRDGWPMKVSHSVCQGLSLVRRVTPAEAGSRLGVDLHEAGQIPEFVELSGGDSAGSVFGDDDGVEDTDDFPVAIPPRPVQLKSDAGFSRIGRHLTRLLARRGTFCTATHEPDKVYLAVHTELRVDR